MTDVIVETQEGESHLLVTNMTSSLASPITVTADNSAGSDEAKFNVVVKGWYKYIFICTGIL